MLKAFLKSTGVVMVALLCAMFLAGMSFAQSKTVEGTYTVTSQSNELGTLNFIMVLKRSGEKWIGEFKDIPTPLTVTTVTVDETNKITIVADASGTPVTIAGKIDGVKMGGDWTAGDIKGTWSAVKKDDVAKIGEKPASEAPSAGAAKVSSATAAELEGTYDAKVIADGQGEIVFVLVIKRDGDNLRTEVTGSGDLNITSVEVKDPDVVNLTATYQGNGPIPLPGKRVAGDEIGGKWEFGGFTGSWTAKKKK
ncbi:MAG: hypothetical protein L0220_18290 [Acidobacteria bacterium]|nr:hypothetical protein [Acidobacteriota bacterium]